MSTSNTLKYWLMAFWALNIADYASFKNAEWDRVVPQSLNSKVINRSEFYEKKELSNDVEIIKIELVELIKSCLILVVKLNGQGHFLAIFCLWSHLFLTFAWHHRSPVAILIQPRDLRAMVRGWTPGMTPSYNSILHKEMFRHDIGIRWIAIRQTFMRNHPRIWVLPTQLQIFITLPKTGFPGNLLKIFISSDSASFTESETLF